MAKNQFMLYPTQHLNIIILELEEFKMSGCSWTITDTVKMFDYDLCDWLILLEFHKFFDNSLFDIWIKLKKQNLNIKFINPPKKKKKKTESNNCSNKPIRH